MGSTHEQPDSSGDVPINESNRIRPIFSSAMDNTTAVAYIQRQGGTKSMSLLSKRDNAFANSIKCRMNMCHILSIFKGITSIWNSHQLDIFATYLIKKLLAYVNPVPDPQALQVDALSMNWTGIFAYAFSPWSLQGGRNSELPLGQVCRGLADCLIEEPLKGLEHRYYLYRSRSDIKLGSLHSILLHEWKLITSKIQASGFSNSASAAVA